MKAKKKKTEAFYYTPAQRKWVLAKASLASNLSYFGWCWRSRLGPARKKLDALVKALEK